MINLTESVEDITSSACRLLVVKPVLQVVNTDDDYDDDDRIS